MILSLRARTIASSLILMTLIGVGIASIAFVAADNGARTEAERALSTEEYLYRYRIAEFERAVQSDLAALAAESSGNGQIGALSSAMRTLRGNGGGTPVRDAFLAGNTSPDDRSAMMRMADNNAYSRSHERTHPELRALLERRGYYDVFLIDAEGLVVYSVAKEDDFGDNVMTGRYRDTGLGDAFRAALETPVGEYAFADFAPYAPSGGRPEAFVATRVERTDPFSGEVRLEGVVAVQISPDRLGLVAPVPGDPEGSRPYLVGPDGFLRTDLVETDDLDILSTRLDRDGPLSAALRSGEKVFLEQTGALGEPVFLAADGIALFGKPMLVVVERPVAAALSFKTAMQFWILVAGLVLLALGAVASYLIGGSMTRPIRMLALATVWTLPYGLWDLGEAEWRTGPVLAVLVLGVVGTGLAFAVMGSLVGRVGSQRASFVTYLIPVVSLALGVVFRDDDVAPLAVVGIGLVISGAVLAGRARR